MSGRLKSTMILILLLIIAVVEAKKAVDPYKILGVDKSANQREIQKAFHRLSLKYHPDKNKNKGAQEKFEEINNAYEILSDEQKRKNYDLYGDERGGPSFDGGNVGNSGGYNHFTSGSGQNQYSFRPDEWQNMGGSGQGARSFSFSFGGSGGGNSFSSGASDFFSNLFGGGNMGGGGGASSFGGFSGPKFGGSQSGFKSPPKLVKTVNSQLFEKEINDKGITWLLLSYTTSMSTQQYDAIFEEIANSLKGPLKVGKINCQNESSFCKKHGIHPRSTPRVFVYSYITSPSGSFVEYNGDMDVKSLKSFCQEHFPRFSKRVNLDNVPHSSIVGERLPRVMLLSTKKDTPVIWFTLSGLLRKRFIFYDAQVSDVTDPSLKRLGVKSLPAIVGWLSNGEKQILKEGISVKDLGSAVQELRVLLEGFETKNKKIASATEKSTSESYVKNIPLLTRSNFDVICGDETPVCLIGAFRSLKVRDKLESILLMASQKSLSRTGSFLFGSKDPISYMILDATQQQTFLKSFDKTGFGTSDGFLLAYKPRKGKFATYIEDLNIEAVERFISSVLSGDIQFKKTRQKPMIK